MGLSITKQDHRLTVLFFLVSFSALLTQVIFMRQTLLLFEQSEYVISLFLFIWLIANGLGLQMGKKTRFLPKSLFQSVQGYTVVIVLFYFGLHFIRPILLSVKTTEVLILGIASTSLCIFIPSFYNGILFSFFTHHKKGTSPVLSLYKTEALAFFIAGGAATLVVYFFSDFYLMAAGLILTQILILGYHFNVKKLLPALFLLLLLIAKPWVQDVSWQMLFSKYDFLKTQQTLSGQTDILYSSENKDTLRLFQGSPVNKVKPPAAPEEASFPAISQISRENPRVLIVGSDIKSLLQGLSFTPFRNIDILIHDPPYFQQIRKGFPKRVRKLLNHKQVNIIHSSVQNHLHNHPHVYDLIYVSEHKPSLMQNALLYFPVNLKILRSGLHKDGVLSLLFGSDAAYAGQISHTLKGSIFQSLNKTFAHSRIFALNNYTILMGASTTLDTSFSSMNQNLMQKGIQSMYFTSSNVGSRMQNAGQIGVSKMKNYSGDLSFNRPVTYLAGLLKMAEKYSVNTANSIMSFANRLYDHSYIWQIVSLLVLNLLFYFFISQSHSLGIVFHAGFTGIAAQMMFIYLYQLHFGNIYLLIGILVALFMVGLVCGLIINPGKKHWLPFVSLLVIILLLTALFFLRIRIIAFSGMFLSGFYTGITFAVNNARNKGNRLSALKLYLSDLLGGLAGNIVIPLLLIPFLGFYLPIAFFLTTGIITVWFQRKISI